MPIVTRGPDGKIIAIHDERRTGDLEEVPADHPEVLEYLKSSGHAQQFLEGLLPPWSLSNRRTPLLCKVEPYPCCTMWLRR